MICAQCQSSNRVDLPAEMVLHFRGLANIDNPGVLMFPEVSVCLDCGFSWFVTPEIAHKLALEQLQVTQKAKGPRLGGALQTRLNSAGDPHT